MHYLAKAFDEVSFSIQLKYPPIASPQSPREVFISATGNGLLLPRTAMFGNILGITHQSKAPITPAPAAPKSSSTQTSNPTEENCVHLFSTATISGASTLAFADNIITLTLVPSNTIPTGTKFTVTGLTGTLPLHLAKTTRPFTSMEPADILQASYQWWNTGCDTASPNCGSLVATVSADLWQSGQKIVLTFSVGNGNLTIMRTGRLSVASSSFCNQSVCGTMGLGSSCKSFSDVLNVKHMPGIVSAVATDSSRTQGETNLVVIGLLPNVQILAGTQFTVTGLLGSATFSTDELKLHGSNSHLFGFHGQFKQHAGVLVVTAERNLGNTQENPAFEISFELTNAATPQPGHNISLSMTLPSGVGTCGRAVCDVLPQIGTKETNPFGLGAYAHEPTNRILARILIVFDDVCGGCQQV